MSLSDIIKEMIENKDLTIEKRYLILGIETKRAIKELIGRLNNSKLRVINNDKLTEEEQLLVQTITTAWKESFNIIIQEVFGEELV